MMAGARWICSHALMLMLSGQRCSVPCDRHAEQQQAGAAAWNAHCQLLPGRRQPHGRRDSLSFAASLRQPASARKCLREHHAVLG